MAGWDELGRVLAGGVNTEAAYQRGQTRAAQLEGLIAQARIKKSEADARANLPGALTKLDAPADLATLFAAGIDPRQLSGYTGDVQEQGFRGDAASRALAGDWGGANAALMGVANGPQALAAVQGQNLLGNVFLEGGGGISTTEQGRAGIAADAARARASDASAASSYASADSTRQRLGIAQQQFALQRAGQWNPDGVSAGAGTSAGGAAKPLPAETRMKMGMLEAAEAAAKKYEGAVFPTGGGFNRTALHVGPAGGQIEEAINNVLRVESGAAVPDSEVAGGVRRYGARVINQEETARANLQQLYDKIRILRENVAGQPAAGDVFSGASSMPGAAPVQRATNPTTGQTLELRNGQWVPAR